MTDLRLDQIRRLSYLATQASAALIPLSSDGRGCDSHGGEFRDGPAVLSAALHALVQAGEIAKSIQENATRA